MYSNEIPFKGIKINPLNTPKDPADGYDFRRIDQILKELGTKMRELKDIPNLEGFEFTGICKDGSVIPCIVRKDSVGMHCAYSMIDNLKCYSKLKGWTTK